MRSTAKDLHTPDRRRCIRTVVKSITQNVQSRHTVIVVRAPPRVRTGPGRARIWFPCITVPVRVKFRGRVGWLRRGRAGGAFRVKTTGKKCPPASLGDVSKTHGLGLGPCTWHVEQNACMCVLEKHYRSSAAIPAVRFPVACRLVVGPQVKFRYYTRTHYKGYTYKQSREQV